MTYTIKDDIFFKFNRFYLFYLTFSTHLSRFPITPCLALRYRFGNPSDNRVVTIATVFPVNPVFDFTNTGNTGFTVSVILV